MIGNFLLFLFLGAIFGVILPTAFFSWMIKKGWIKPSGNLLMEFRDRADGTVVYAWQNGAPLRFVISVQKGQTLLFHNEASCFTGSVCFRPVKRQPPVA